MTTRDFKVCKCSICGAENKFSVLMSTNEFGSPDLDLRPAEMKRSTMDMWIQECPVCGYVSEEVSDESVVTVEWLKSESYITCDGIGFKSELAMRFYKHYLINMEDKNLEDAFFAIHSAAWVCDDTDDEENGRICREKAIDLATILIKKGSDMGENLKLVQVDLMRRVGQFDSLIEKYSDTVFDEEIMNQILEFQLKKAKERDRSCYRVEDVIQRNKPKGQS